MVIKNKNIKIEELKIKPFKITPKLLEELKKTLIEKKKLLALHKSWVIQLTPDIEEIEEILLNAGVTQEMLDKWYE